MGSDISRIRHNPLKDFGGLVMQQGRLLLDADFNEYVAMLDRRLRAETCDLTSFGPDPNQAGVAWVPRLTPNGFRVTASGGSLSIGRGRMYVDGLLAENHGAAPLGFDELLSDVTGTGDTPYDEQPYWDTPDALPTSGTHLAYLDVWQREVTSLEDPDLVEVAVGVDTSARLQTVWQVRVLDGAGSGACTADDADITGWLDIIQPSSGRLSTDTIAVDPSDDPCELPPSGGYRGLENQTYRVEVHDDGAPGTATFKWSRDDASVAVPIVEMVSTTKLRVSSLGRDDVLRISTGDWVEILDDHREFNKDPGVMRKVVVDDAARTISFTPALPTNLRPADAADAANRHLRARRWDQSGTVKSAGGATLETLDAPGSSGLIKTPALSTTQVVLEHGIVASFSVDGASGEFRSGDYWVFAARTADTSVETLVDDPPRGIHHHYARLGTVTFPSTQTDCRRMWPPIATGGDSCGDCTVCITPELHASGSLTLQNAVDLIAETGGTICLSAGVYELGSGVVIDKAKSVKVKGQGLATILVASGPALTVTSSVGVTIENLSIITGAQSASAVVLHNVVGANVQDTAILSYGSEEVESAAIELSGAALLVAIRRNVLVGRVGIDGTGDGEIGVLAADLSIEDNVVGGVRGVDLGGRSLYLVACRVSANEVVAATGDGVRATGVVAPGGSLEVGTNRVIAGGIGIAVGADASVVNNTVNGIGDNRGGDGIVVADGGFPAEAGHVHIIGNRIHGRNGAGIALEIPVATFMVKQNIISDAGAGIVIGLKGQADHVAVDNNVVEGIRVEDDSTAFGIALTNAKYVDVSANTVSDVGLDLVEGVARVGILVVGCADARLAGNVVHDVGRTDGFVGLASGIAAIGPFENTILSENSVRFSGDSSGPQEGTWIALLVASSLGQLGSLGKRASVRVDDGAVVFTEGWAYAVETRGDHATLSGNTLTGGGRQPTCLVSTGGDVVATANQCAHVGESVGMQLGGRTVAASSNRIREAESMLVIQAQEEHFSAVGNLAAGGTHFGGPGNGLPAPWDALNPSVPI